MLMMTLLLPMMMVVMIERKEPGAVKRKWHWLSVAVPLSSCLPLCLLAYSVIRLFNLSSFCSFRSVACELLWLPRFPPRAPLSSRPGLSTDLIESNASRIAGNSHRTRQKRRVPFSQLIRGRANISIGEECLVDST